MPKVTVLRQAMALTQKVKRQSLLVLTLMLRVTTPKHLEVLLTQKVVTQKLLEKLLM
jgi:hypothetical protein